MNETEYYKNGPSEWNYKKLGDVVTFQGGSQPAKKYFSNDKSEGMIRLIQIRDYKNDNFITYVPKELCRRFCDVDDIMIGRYGPPIFQILRGIEGAYNIALIKAIPNEEIINKNYLYYFIKNEHLFKLIDGLSQRTSGQTGIDMDVLKKYIIPIPNLTEQEKIAEILSTVDEQIENTEKLIQKNQELKKGLMQQLLTKGIGHTEFKKTEFGDIPDIWEIKKLSELANVIDSLHETPEYSEQGYPMIRVVDVNGKEINTKYTKFVSKDVFDKFTKKYIPKKNDIIMSRVGSYGQVSYLETDEKVCLGQNTVVITTDFDKKYIFYALSSNYVKNNIEKVTSGSSQKTLSLANIKDLKLLLPRIEEQNKIVAILSSIDEKIDKYQSKKIRLEEIKKGLMQQLLTGKIRVVL